MSAMVACICFLNSCVAQYTLPHTQTFAISLQALLQAVKQEDRHLQEVETLTAALLRTCTREGQTALSQEVQTLLCRRSKLQKSISKQLGHPEHQRKGEEGFEVSSQDLHHFSCCSSIVQAVYVIELSFILKKK